MVAALALAELWGPVGFSHWHPVTNEPVGKRRSSAWIQVAAVSQDQTRNTFTLFPQMITPKLKAEAGIEINKTIIYAQDGRMIEGVTSSPMALEGKRPTFVIMNEVQWWIETNDGHQMYSVIEGNVTKSRLGAARYLAICNAHVPGQESIGERLWDSYQAVEAGTGINTGILYDALEAPAGTPISEIPFPTEDPEGFAEGVRRLSEGLEIARGDSVWLDVETIVGSILDTNNLVSESRRKYLNQINAAEDAWISPDEWNSILTSDKIKPGEMVTMGFDGSKSGDHTALVICRVSDGLLELVRVWNPERYGGEVPREAVDAVVRSMFERYKVVGFRADVKEFESYVDGWSKDFKRVLKVKASPNNPVAFDMRGQTKRFALDCEKFYDAVIEKAVWHRDDPLLKSHVLNAKLNPTNFDAVSIRKASKDSSLKIDAAVCAVLAYGSRQDYLMSKKSRTGKVMVLR